MSFQEDHAKAKAAMPADVREAHTRSSRHRAQIEASTVCGCFYCLAKFAPQQIDEWVDEDTMGRGTTAICPRCGIDSVLGDASGYDLDGDLLRRMHACWFEA